MELLDRVRETIQAHELAHSGTRVVVALSGGSDSVALAHLLKALATRGELSVVGVVHFNHQLRPAADADERFCAELAAAFDWPFVAERAPVAERARSEGRSIEDAARSARYECFARARRHLAADVVALGHTRDDQAETFLLRLLRGAGSRGLAAMHPRREGLIRPLLDCRRAELRVYLASRNIRFVRDESNDDVTVPRNRIRAELLPFIEQRFNPGIVGVLADEAEIAREEWRWMDAAAREAAARACRREDRQWRMDAAALRDLPLGLRRLVVRIPLEAAAGGRPVSFAHVETVIRLAVHGGPPVSLPGHRAERVGGDVVLTTAAPERGHFFQYPLSIPGEVELPEAGCVVSAELAPSAAGLGAILGRPAGAERDAGAVGVVQLADPLPPLTVRSRRPGDRFRPLGLKGRKKLQDFFVDRKVARQRRDLVPLVVDPSDRIVWVAGHCIDDAFRVTDPAQAVLILRLKQV
jgi:tRNA(Ile)-lysidine synthase